MRNIDHFSYELGAADCFCEMVRAGVKQIALAHPCDTREARDEYLPYFEDLCQKYGVKLYVEDVPLLTDLFPLSMNQGKYNAIFYQEDSALDAYLALKAEKQAALEAGAYTPETRLGHRLAVRQAAVLHRSGHPAAAGTEPGEGITTGGTRHVYEVQSPAAGPWGAERGVSPYPGPGPAEGPAG